MSDLNELFGKIAYAETPEERDDAEREIRQMLADARDEGYNQALAAIIAMRPTSDPRPYEPKP